MISVLRLGNTPEFKPVKIADKDRYKHIFIAGMPGAGKSALITNMISQDSILPTAKIIIDPSGFLAKDAMALSKNVLYCSLDNPVGLNPMLEDYVHDDIADNLSEVVNQVVQATTKNVELTVRMLSVLREETVWCLQNGRKRLDSLVDAIKNHSKAHAETRQSLIDRLNLFIQDERLFQILCEAPTVSWEDIIENKRTFILDCHGMSEPKMIFLGTIVTHAIKSYLRYSKKTEFKPLVMYIDEAHLFINPNFFTILKEGRKYKVSAVLATQDFANVPEKLTKTILSNVGTLIAFRTGFMEASLLSREFPTLQTKDLQNLPKFHCAFRTPKEEGICKTLPPPYIPKRVQPAAVQGFKGNEMKDEWFDVHESCLA